MVNEVDCCLKYGKNISNSQIKLLYFGIFIVAIIPVIAIVAIILFAFGNENISKDMIPAFVGASLMSLFILFVEIYFLKHIKKIKKHIHNCLLDSKELIGFVERLDLQNPLVYQIYQIKVNFKYKSKEISLISSRQNILIGYPKCFIKYNLKKVKILYSEKFNEVLIVRQS